VLGDFSSLHTYAFDGTVLNQQPDRPSILDPSRVRPGSGYSACHELAMALDLAGGD
jgi:hypothetical protein